MLTGIWMLVYMLTFVLRNQSIFKMTEWKLFALKKGENNFFPSPVVAHVQCGTVRIFLAAEISWQFGLILENV